MAIDTASDCSDDHLPCSTNTKVSDASQEQIGDEQVERAPQHVDQRRRFSLTWGDANGVGNLWPVIPLMKCGMRLTRKTPPKKYDT